MWKRTEEKQKLDRKNAAADAVFFCFMGWVWDGSCLWDGGCCGSVDTWMNFIRKCRIRPGSFVVGDGPAGPWVILTAARASTCAETGISIRKRCVCPGIFIPGDGRWAAGDSNESHSAYIAKNGLFANVTNLSHAIAYAQVLFSVFEPE